eukprot:33093_1
MAEGDVRGGEQVLATKEKRKVFVGALSFNTTEAGLRSKFSPYGEIETIQLMKDRASGRSRGFGFITFKSQEMAKLALDAKPHELDGRTLQVSIAQPRDMPHGDERSVPKLYIGGLSYTTTNDGFRAFFEEFGELSDTVVMRDKASGKSRGFGFATYTTHDETENALAACGTELDGRPLDIKLAVPKREMDMIAREKCSSVVYGDPAQDNKVYVKGLGDDVTEADMKNYFRRFGAILDTVLIRDKETKASRGFGFVTFETIDSSIHTTLSTHRLKGKELTCQRATPRPQKGAGGYPQQPQPQGYAGGGFRQQQPRGGGYQRGGFRQQQPRGGGYPQPQQPRGGYQPQRPQSGYGGGVYQPPPQSGYNSQPGYGAQQSGYGGGGYQTTYPQQQGGYGAAPFQGRAAGGYQSSRYTPY